MNLIWLAVAWVSGMLLETWLALPVLGLALLCLPPLALVLLWRDRLSWRRLGLYGLVFVAGAWRVLAMQPQIDAHHVAFYNDGPDVALTGVIVADPDIRDQYTYLRVRAESLTAADGTRPVRGDVWVRTSRYPYRTYGDRLEIVGRLETPPEDADFSYRQYLARQGIYSMMSRPRLTLLATDEGSRLLSLLYGLRRRAQATLAAILPEPEASLLTGILLGIESTLPEEVVDAFTRTGTIHIIVISGFNLTLVAGLFIRAGVRFWGRRPALLAACGGIVLYTLFVGATPPVVRAALMVAVALLAHGVGRPYAAGRALAAAAIVMTALNPGLLWSASFQLSFAATVGLIVLAPLLERKFGDRLVGWLPPEAQAGGNSLLRELLVASLAAQLTTLPVILYHFQRLSLVALAANALILPVQPYLMTLGGVAAGLGLLWLPLGQAAASIPWLFAAYTVRVVEWAARPAWASVMVPFPGWLVVVYYAALATAVWWWRHRAEPGPRLRAAWQNARQRSSAVGLLAGVALVAALVWVAVLSLPDGRLHVSFLDVGQGDAILIQTPNGQQILVDGGPEPSRLLSALGRRMPFWDRTLDLVVLTHPDSDHLAGLIPVLERYQVAAVLCGEWPATSAAVAQWQALLSDKAIARLPAETGTHVVWGDPTRLQVLHPPADWPPATAADDNNRSLVLRLTHDRVAFLLTGDIEAAAEAHLVSGGQLAPAWVLKVSHHGAAAGTSAAFLRQVQPRLAVISVGADNYHGHPAAETLQRLHAAGAQVLRTDQQGTIELITDGVTLEIRTAR